MAGEKTRGEIIDWLASYYSAYYDVHRPGRRDASAGASMRSARK